MITKSSEIWIPSDLAGLNNCLEKLLASPIFVKSNRQQNLLRYLFNETLIGNAQRLKGYTVGVEVFNRETNFDQGSDAIVRVEVGRLRAKLLEYYNSHGKDDPFLIDLPKGGYVLNFSSRDFTNFITLRTFYFQLM